LIAVNSAVSASLRNSTISDDPCTTATLAQRSGGDIDAYAGAPQELLDRVATSTAAAAGPTLRGHVVDGDLGVPDEFADLPIVDSLAMADDHAV
jgi:hypothetical protein